MGYMGFGMQRWIYDRKVRKPFKKRESLGNADLVEKYYAIKSTDADKAISSPSNGKTEDISENQGNTSTQNKSTGILTILGLLSLVILLFLYFEPWAEWNRDTDPTYDAKQINKESLMISYDDIIERGRQYFSDKDYEAAIIEFKKALSIEPSSEEALTYLTKSYAEDCIANNNHCENAEALLIKRLEQKPDDEECASYKKRIGKKKNE